MQSLAAALRASPLVVTALAAGCIPASAWAQPKPVASVPLPDDAARGSAFLTWVGFDPTGRFLAAHYPGRHESFVTVWDAARWDPVLSASAALGRPLPGFERDPGGFADFGPPAGFLPSGSHLVYLPEHSIGALRGRPLGAAVGRIDVPEWSGPRPPPGVDNWSLWAGAGSPDIRRVGITHERDRVVVQSTSAEKPQAFSGSVGRTGA